MYDLNVCDVTVFFFRSHLRYAGGSNYIAYGQHKRLLPLSLDGDEHRRQSIVK